MEGSRDERRQDGGRWDRSSRNDNRSAYKRRTRPDVKREEGEDGEKHIPVEHVTVKVEKEERGRRPGADPSQPLCETLGKRAEGEWANLPTLEYRKTIVEMVKGNQVKARALQTDPDPYGWKRVQCEADWCLMHTACVHRR